MSKIKLQNIEHNYHNHQVNALGIYFAKCVRIVNGRIILIKTETKTSLGGKATYYFPAERVYAKQDKPEYETVSGQKIDKGIYQFVVQSNDGSRSVEIKAEKDDDGYYIEYPKFGDDDLLRALPNYHQDLELSVV